MVECGVHTQTSAPDCAPGVTHAARYCVALMGSTGHPVTELTIKASDTTGLKVKWARGLLSAFEHSLVVVFVPEEPFYDNNQNG